MNLGDGKLVITFRGKGGKSHRISLRDARLARIVRSCKELPGQHLFQYLDDSGERRSVDSADVNGYLEEIAAQPFTAKDFRTWAGTVLAATALGESDVFETEAAAKRNVTLAIEQVAAQLGNTVAVCRKSYIHPEIVASYLDGSIFGHLNGSEVLEKALAGLRREEACVLALLQERIGRAAARNAGAKPLTGRKLKAALRRSIEKEATQSATASPS